MTKKHKLFSILIAVIYMLRLIPASCAGDELTISSPANGSVVSYKTSVFELMPPSGKTIVKTLFILDGRFLGNGDENAMYAYDDVLTVGSHTLEAIAVYDDGTAEKAVSEFCAAVIPDSTVIDFEEVEPAEFESSEDALRAIKGLGGINGGIYNNTNKGKVAVEEEEGFGKVLKIKTTTERMLVGGAYITAYANPTIAPDGTASNKAVKSGKLGLSFDAWIPYSSKGGEITQLNISPYQSSGAPVKSHNIAINNKILNTYVITPGWFSVSLVYDLDNLVCYGTITDADEGTTWEIEKSKLADSPINISSYRIGARIERENYWAIDNIKTGMIESFCGITDILVKDEDNPNADENGYVDAKKFGASRDMTQMLIRLDRPLDPSTVSKENIFVAAGGSNIKISDVVYDENESSAIITLDNPGITTNGETHIKLSENIRLRGEGSALGAATEARFSLIPQGFEIKDVEFSRCGSEIYCASQLSEGDALTCSITISNTTEADAALTAVLVIKDGMRFLSVTPVEIEVSAGAADCTATVTSKEIASADNICASVIFVNSLSDAVYVDSADLL